MKLDFLCLKVNYNQSVPIVLFIISFIYWNSLDTFPLNSRVSYKPKLIKLLRKRKSQVFIVTGAYSELIRFE